MRERAGFVSPKTKGEAVHGRLIGWSGFGAVTLGVATDGAWILCHTTILAFRTRASPVMHCDAQNHRGNVHGAVSA